MPKARGNKSKRKKTMPEIRPGEDMLTVTEEAPPKRRRGRPRKAPIPGTALLNLQLEGLPIASVGGIRAEEVSYDSPHHDCAHAVISSLTPYIRKVR